jgi:hypothetical protein
MCYLLLSLNKSQFHLLFNPNEQSTVNSLKAMPAIKKPDLGTVKELPHDPDSLAFSRWPYLVSHFSIVARPDNVPFKAGLKGLTPKYVILSRLSA